MDKERNKMIPTLTPNLPLSTMSPMCPFPHLTQSPCTMVTFRTLNWWEVGERGDIR